MQSVLLDILVSITLPLVMTYQLALSALAEPTRRHIFETISMSPQSVGSVAKELPISRPAVSQHLKVLVDANLLSAEKRGTQNIYRTNPQGLTELREYLDGFWDEVLDSFAAEIEKQEGLPE